MNRREFLYLPLAASAAASASPSDAPFELPSRQLHLDFHTSELVPEVGADFNEREFASSLAAARVNSINVFAKCHHGYAYYASEIATPHPSMKGDLLAAMLRACRSLPGFRVNYYYSLARDVLQSRLHPEWLSLDSQGKPITDNWPSICLNSPYFDQVLRENREIVAKYNCDGAFFDITRIPPDGCYCRWCTADRQRLGLTNDIPRFNQLVIRRVEQALFDLVRQPPHAQASVFFNSRPVLALRGELPAFTHLETESRHFQTHVRYVRTLTRDYVGMAGDFEGPKNDAALEYECFSFVANGAKSCIRDQLKPSGRLDAATCRRIGAVYRKLEALETWTTGCRAVADIGVVVTEATVDQQFTNMLLELHQQFDVLDPDADFALYKVLILPDEIAPNARLIQKIERFLERGGALLSTGRSLLDEASGRFALSALGVRFKGASRSAGEYPLLKPDAFPGIENASLTLFERGLSVEVASPDVEVLASYGRPHDRTAAEAASDQPLITRNGRVIYIAYPVFRSAAGGYEVLKRVVGQLIQLLLPRPSVIAPNLPSAARVTMLEQRIPGQTRRIVHLLCYPMSGGIIEKPGLLENVQLSVSLPQHPLGVVLVPSEQPLEFKHNEFYTTFTVPRVAGHQAIAFE